MRDIKIYPDAQLAAEACAVVVLNWLDKAINESPAGLATLAVSGGTSPALMFETMTNFIFRWERVHLFWVDERMVPPADSQSNFKLANDHWLKAVGFPESNIHRVRTELPPPEAARQYADDIRDFFELQPGELPKFDVIHRGMGPDAHTASLFPDEPLIADRQNIAAPVWVEKFGQWRITLLPGVLEAARHTAMLVTGADKAGALAQVFNLPYDPRSFPAQLATQEGSPAVWFADEAAAASLA